MEMTVSVSIALVAFLMIYKFMSSSRHHYMYGTVNLQNLQEARLAINFLRRDFSCACPRFEEGGAGNFQSIQKLQKQVFDTGTVIPDAKGDLILITDQGIAFHRFRFDSPDVFPVVERVTYDYDPTTKTLTRRSEDGRVNSFTGFDNVQFKLYTHQVNKKIPILWVSLKIHEGENIYGSEKVGTELELTTSITSPYISSNLSNLSWRNETGHKKM